MTVRMQALLLVGMILIPFGLFAAAMLVLEPATLLVAIRVVKLAIVVLFVGPFVWAMWQWMVDTETPVPTKKDR